MQEFDPSLGPILSHWCHISTLLSGQAEVTHLFKDQEMFHNHLDSIIEDKHEPSIEKLFLSMLFRIKDDFEFSWLVLELLDLPVVKNVALYPNPLISLLSPVKFKVQQRPCFHNSNIKPSSLNKKRCLIYVY